MGGGEKEVERGQEDKAGEGGGGEQEGRVKEERWRSRGEESHPGAGRRCPAGDRWCCPAASSFSSSGQGRCTSGRPPLL